MNDVDQTESESWVGRILVAGALHQTSSQITHVRNRKGLVFSHFLLDCRIPLRRERKVELRIEDIELSSVRRGRCRGRHSKLRRSQGIRNAGEAPARNQGIA